MSAELSLRSRLAAGLRVHGLALAVLLLAIGAALWPLPQLLVQSGEDPRAIGHPGGDFADHYWGTWWFGGELLKLHWPHTTSVVQYPGPVDLWYVDPVGGFLGLLLRPLGFPFVWNLLVLVQVALAAGLAYAFAWRVTQQRTAALVAGVTLGCSSYVIGLVHSGLSEYLGLAFPVAFVWALIRTMGLDPLERPPPRHGVLLTAALLTGCALQAFYYAAFGALLTGAAVIGAGWRERLRTAVKVAVVFGLLSAPLFAVAYSSLTSENAAVNSQNAPGWAYQDMPATDLLTFVRWGEHYFPVPTVSNPGIRHVNHLGLAVLALVGWGLWRGRRQAALRALLPMTAIYAVCSLGPRLCIDGQLYNWGSGAFPLPLAILYIPGSPFRFVHHPYRLVAFLIPLLALLAAIGAARLPRALRVLAIGLIVGESLLLSPAPWPIETARVRVPQVYADLPEGPVLDWPPDATRWNRRYAVWQVAHHRPIAYGVNTFLPDRLRRDPMVARLMRELRDPERRARNRDIAFNGPLLLPTESGPSQLETWGYRAIVVHPDALSEGEWVGTQQVLIDAFGPPAIHADNASAWILP